MQKNFKCQQCGHRFVAEDDLSTVCPECGSDLLQPINTRKVQPWMYAAAFIVFLAIGFGVSELIQPKLFAKAEDDVAIEQEPAGYEEEGVYEEPVMEEPSVTTPATDNPVAAPSKPYQPNAQPTTQPAVTPSAPSTPASEPRPATTTPSTPAVKPTTETVAASEPKPVVTTTPSTPAAKPATAVAPEPKPVVTPTPTPAPAPTKTGLTAAEAQGILASGKTSSKIPDGTKITVNGQRMDYQSFRQGVNTKAFSNIKVTGVNPDGSITVTATSHYED